MQILKGSYFKIIPRFALLEEIVNYLICILDLGLCNWMEIFIYRFKLKI